MKAKTLISFDPSSQTEIRKARALLERMDNVWPAATPSKAVAIDKRVVDAATEDDCIQLKRLAHDLMEHMFEDHAYATPTSVKELYTTHVDGQWRHVTDSAKVLLEHLFVQECLAAVAELKNYSFALHSGEGGTIHYLCSTLPSVPVQIHLRKPVAPDTLPPVTDAMQPLIDALAPFATAYHAWGGDNAMRHFERSLTAADYAAAAEVYDAFTAKQAAAVAEDECDIKGTRRYDVRIKKGTKFAHKRNQTTTQLIALADWDDDISSLLALKVGERAEFDDGKLIITRRV